MFKPKIHECQVVDGDETFTFYVREPSGREILDQVAKVNLRQAREAKLQKRIEAAIEAGDDAKALELSAMTRSSVDNAREMFAYIVKGPDDPEPIAKDDVEALIDMRLTAMQKISEKVQETIGVKKVAEKKD